MELRPQEDSSSILRNVRQRQTNPEAAKKMGEKEFRRFAYR